MAQTRARTHPGVLDTQKWLLSLFHTSDPTSPVSISTPISYYDRLRIRHPGDAVFALGPHIDGGSLERWEDPGELRTASRFSPRRLGALRAGGRQRKDPIFSPEFLSVPSNLVLVRSARLSYLSLIAFSFNAGFRSCFRGILAGGPDPHVRHDPWDLTPRLNANTDLYSGSGQCSVFRMFQGESGRGAYSRRVELL